jgi:hypothetical protein
MDQLASVHPSVNGIHRRFEDFLIRQNLVGLQILTMMMHRPYHFIVSVLLVVLFSHEVAAFQNTRVPQSSDRRSATLSAAPLSPEEERAAALSDYLAKSHVEKLRAIKEVEMKKNSEIEQLKQQITELKESSTTTTSSNMVLVNGGENVKSLEEMSKEELVNKITQYQNFMRQYMIDAQEQKYRAVKAAEVAARKKLAESMTLLGLSPSATTTETTTSVPPLFAARNAAVAKAAAAGTSRWGPLEVQRASSVAASTTPMATPAISSSPLYAARNAAVTKAAAAGQSRWGSAEVQRAGGVAIEPSTKMSVNGGSAPVMTTAALATPAAVSIPVPPEVAEADHGLRSDGSIGGLSLAERVYFGAKNGVSAPPIPTPPEVLEADHGLRSDGSIGGPTLAERIFYGAAPASASTSTTADPREALFARRNLKVLQAARAGHSRWGSQEIDRVANIVAVTPQLPASVAAPSSRVNFGAAILGQQ